MVQRVALIGFGRFGGSFADMVQAAGIEVRAHDPQRDVPAPLRAADVSSLVRGAELVVFAVPVPAFEKALVGMLPHLSSRHLVIDVGSVKLGPERVMDRHLGGRIPWVATHPLFGPTSIARQDAPLDVVVCPNPQHPSAVDVVTSFYRDIGCNVTRKQSEEHDRTMARTHALVFFLARGLVDMKAGDGVRFVPPSFRALESAIEAVRSDADHLFHAIQSENVHAPAAREELLETLRMIHDSLPDARREADRPVDPGSGSTDQD
jgi:prephenate dehydrogenase